MMTNFPINISFRERAKRDDSSAKNGSGASTANEDKDRTTQEMISSEGDAAHNVLSRGKHEILQKRVGKTRQRVGSYLSSGLQLQRNWKEKQKTGGLRGAHRG